VKVEEWDISGSAQLLSPLNHRLLASESSQIVKTAKTKFHVSDFATDSNRAFQIRLQ
jgi:hypothetical protein